MNNSGLKARHPCFNVEVKGTCGRVHLPVAPKCNIRCNYCDRKYDCVNESRPGVTSCVLTPHQAVAYLEKVLQKEPRITVAGIAGPGDPFANPEETMETLRLIRAKYPELLLCLATNGLGIAPHVEELGSLGVTHVTITINAVDPVIGAKIYAWVRDGKVVYRKKKGAELLLARQRTAIKALKEQGITVKANFIAIPGINTDHIEEVARELKDLGVDLFNCMAMFPNPGAQFGNIPQPTPQMMYELRAISERYLPQMRHCTRCRADAVGLLEKDQTGDFQGCLSACSKLPIEAHPGQRPYIAIATREGILINQHLGEAAYLEIWEVTEQGPHFVERRPTPSPGTGLRRWIKLADQLKDCRYLLVSGIGERPKEVLKRSGIRPLEISGLIEECLGVIRTGGRLDVFKRGIKACSGGAGKGCV